MASANDSGVNGLVTNRFAPCFSAQNLSLSWFLEVTMITGVFANSGSF